MEELVKIYNARGDESSAEKYRNKINIVKDNIRKDKLTAEEIKKNSYN